MIELACCLIADSLEGIERFVAVLPVDLVSWIHARLQADMSLAKRKLLVLQENLFAVDGTDVIDKGHIGVFA